MSGTYVYRGGQPDPARHAAPKGGLVPLDRMTFHSHNVRRDLGDLRELADSIRRHGVITPVVLEQRGQMFRIRAGHRRVAAARLAGLKRVPALVHGTALDDADWVVNSVQENHHRRGLSPQDRRDVIARLRGEGFTWESIAIEFGVSTGTVQRWAKDDDAAPTSPARRQSAVIGRRRVAGLIEQLRVDINQRTAAEVLGAFAELIDPEPPQEDTR